LIFCAQVEFGHHQHNQFDQENAIKLHIDEIDVNQDQRPTKKLLKSYATFLHTKSKQQPTFHANLFSFH
jgi:hypothetical protein